MEYRKTCQGCGRWKLLSEFHRRTASPDGRQYRCKACNTAASAKWRADHPGYDAEYNYLNHRGR